MSNGSVSFNDFFIKYILLVSAGMVYKMLISSYIFWREDERKKKTPNKMHKRKGSKKKDQDHIIIYAELSP
jgi:Na+/H+ antiporter NhaD/arsenite permease-like protein